MNFFESELKKIMGNSNILKDQKYVGRMCYGTISEDLRARIEFVTLGVHDHYAGLKTSIINRKEGVVDSMLLRFTDIWGKPKVSNPNFREGVSSSDLTMEKVTGMCFIRQMQIIRSWQPEWKIICPFFRIWQWYSRRISRASR